MAKIFSDLTAMDSHGNGTSPEQSPINKHSDVRVKHQVSTESAVLQLQDQNASPARMAATRKSRTRNWPARSDPHQKYPSLARHMAKVGDMIHQIGQGMDSGRNLLAIFEDCDEEPRLAYNVRCRNGRSKIIWPKFKSVKEIDMPIGTTLKQICHYFPLHVWGDGMRIFIAEGWTAEQIWREIPVEARNSGAANRPWNYLQQAMGREADKMYEESGGEKRVLVKRKRPETENDENDEQGELSSAKRPAIRKDHLPTFENSPIGISEFDFSPLYDEGCEDAASSSSKHSLDFYATPSFQARDDFVHNGADPQLYKGATFVDQYGSPQKRQRVHRSNSAFLDYYSQDSALTPSQHEQYSPHPAYIQSPQMMSFASPRFSQIQMPSPYASKSYAQHANQFSSPEHRTTQDISGQLMYSPHSSKPLATSRTHPSTAMLYDPVRGQFTGSSNIPIAENAFPGTQGHAVSLVHPQQQLRFRVGKVTNASSPAMSSKRTVASADISDGHAYEDCFSNAASRGYAHPELRDRNQQKAVNTFSSAPGIGGAIVDCSSSSVQSGQALCSYPDSFPLQISGGFVQSKTGFLGCDNVGPLEQVVHDSEGFDSFSNVLHQEVDHSWIEQDDVVDDMVGSLDVHQMKLPELGTNLNSTCIAAPMPLKTWTSFLDSEIDSSHTIPET